MKTLRVEPVYPMAYETFTNITSDLPHFINRLYRPRLMRHL